MESSILITGAAGGLGKALAAECAARGWNVFLTDCNATPLKRFCESLENTFGIKVYQYPCNLTDDYSREDFYTFIREKGFRFRGLINVAGIDYEGLFMEKTAAEISNLVRLNIEAVLMMTNEVLKFRDTGKTFRLINVSSLAAFYPLPVKAAYAASKRFLLDFSMALRYELSGTGTVTVLCPAGMPNNQSSIQGIDAQGIMGRLTTKNVGFVAEGTINAAMKGRPVYIPGLINRTLVFLGKLVPRHFAVFLIGRRWKAVQQHPRAEIFPLRLQEGA